MIEFLSGRENYCFFADESSELLDVILISLEQICKLKMTSRQWKKMLAVVFIMELFPANNLNRS